MNAYPNLAYPGQQYQQPYSQQYYPPQQYAPSNSNPYAQPYGVIKTNQQYPQQNQQQIPQQYYPQQYQQYPQQYQQQQHPQQYAPQNQQQQQQQQYNPYNPYQQQQQPQPKQSLTDAEKAQLDKVGYAKTPTQFTQVGNEKEQEQEKKFIVHKIEFTDSLEGLALQYNVSAREIKIFNGLTTNDIYYMKEIKIPNPDLENLHPSSEVLDEEELRRRQKLHTMRQVMDKDDAKVAQFYLEDNEWDINKAIDHYKQDVLFEKQHQETLKQKKNK